MNKKMNTKDYIFAGAFAALYLVILLGVVMLLSFNPVTFLMVPLIIGIVEGPVFTLYISKVPKKGAVIILAVLAGLIMSSTSFFPLVISVIAGITAEIIMGGKGRNLKARSTAAYAVYNISVTGPFSLLFFAREEFFKATGEYYGQVYVDKLEALAPNWIFIALVDLALIGGFLGAKLGYKLNKKHFERAGII